MIYETRKFTWLLNRRVLVHIVTAILVALLVLIMLAPILARPAYADHSEMDVVCPPPISEGETAHMQVRWPGHKSVRVAAFTLQDADSADSTDFVTYDGAWMEGSSDSNTVHVPAITKEDSTPEPNETFSIGFYDNGVWRGCVVTIADDDMPEITNVAITSSPAKGMFYRFQENIDFTVTLNKEVEIEGTPRLSLTVGDGDSSWRGANYLSGSGSNALVFRYQVQAKDIDNDGVSVRAAATDADRNPAYGFSGTIYAKGTKAQIDYAHDGISNSSKHRVEGRPYVHSVGFNSTPPNGWKAYRTNQVVEVSYAFNTDVEVQGNVTVNLAIGYDNDNWGAALRQAGYMRGSGTDTLVFVYTIRPGDMDPKGIIIAGAWQQSGFKGDGTIKAKGTDVEAYPYFLGKNHSWKHRVDTAAPTISSITIESRPGNGRAYATGETISVAAVFSEKITIAGDPQLELDIGGVTRQAAVHSDAPRSASASQRGYGDRIVFQYQVTAEDADSDGIGISANSLKLNGGGIYDNAGNAAGLSHTTVAADPAQKVGGSE